MTEKFDDIRILIEKLGFKSLDEFDESLKFLLSNFLDTEEQVFLLGMILKLYKENQVIKNDNNILANSLNDIIDDYIKTKSQLISKTLNQNKRIQSIEIALLGIKVASEEASKFMDPIGVDKTKKKH